MAKRPRPNLSLEMILDAAAAVMERDGYNGLTMRVVALELQVQAPAIYWYVKDKQALELALYDHLQRDLNFAPVGDDWRQDMRRMGQELRRHMLSHRDIGRLLPHGFFFAPVSAARMDLVIGLLLEAGLSPKDAFYAFTTGFTYVANWAMGEAEMRRRPPGVRPGLDEEAKALIASGALPNFARSVGAFSFDAAYDEQFLFGLDALIAGFERLIVQDRRGP